MAEYIVLGGYVSKLEKGNVTRKNIEEALDEVKRGFYSLGNLRYALIEGTKKRKRKLERWVKEDDINSDLWEESLGRIEKNLEDLNKNRETKISGINIPNKIKRTSDEVVECWINPGDYLEESNGEFFNLEKGNIVCSKYVSNNAMKRWEWLVLGIKVDERKPYRNSSSTRGVRVVNVNPLLEIPYILNEIGNYLRDIHPGEVKFFK